MPRIYVEYGGMKRTAEQTQLISQKINSIRSEFSRKVDDLDWDILFQQNILMSAVRISNKLQKFEGILNEYSQFLNDARIAYEKIDKYEIDKEEPSTTNNLVGNSNKSVNIASNSSHQIQTNSKNTMKAATKAARTVTEVGSVASLVARKIDEQIKAPFKITFNDKIPRAYGADQGHMAHSRRGDQDLYKFIRLHDRYKNYTDDQIDQLLARINGEGCGYAAMTNNIFSEFEGWEEEFEKEFGFPMYDKNGKPNFDYLLLDIYAKTDDQYYLHEAQGATSLVNDILLEEYYDKDNDIWKKAAFKEKYGCDLYVNGKINPLARQRVLNQYQGQSVVTYEKSGTTQYSFTNRLSHYLNEKAISHSIEIRNGHNLPSTSEVNDYLNSGKNVNIRSEDFSMYDQNGNIVKSNVGHHRMTVTGVTPDGQYIVSSWGEKYFLKPEELKDVNFVITDINV